MILPGCSIMVMRNRTAGAVWLAVVVFGLPSARARSPRPRSGSGPVGRARLALQPPGGDLGKGQGRRPRGLLRGRAVRRQADPRLRLLRAARDGRGPLPAMVLVHGGGGKAFREWAELWAERGYVALAMDLAGHGPDGKRLARRRAGPGRRTQVPRLRRRRGPGDLDLPRRRRRHPRALAAGRAAGGRPRPDRHHRHLLGRLPDLHRRRPRRPPQGRRAGLRLRLPPREQRLAAPLRRR